MAYIDGFVLPVLKVREKDYQAWAKFACAVWMEHGALSYMESRADDVPEGQVTSFPKAVALEEGEIVYFSFATYRDRAHRDEVNAKVMADPRLEQMFKDSPANMQRMIYGGFEIVVRS